MPVRFVAWVIDLCANFLSQTEFSDSSNESTLNQFLIHHHASGTYFKYPIVASVIAVI